MRGTCGLTVTERSRADDDEQQPVKDWRTVVKSSKHWGNIYIYIYSNSVILRYYASHFIYFIYAYNICTIYAHIVLRSASLLVTNKNLKIQRLAFCNAALLPGTVFINHAVTTNHVHCCWNNADTCKYIDTFFGIHQKPKAKCTLVTAIKSNKKYNSAHRKLKKSHYCSDCKRL